MGSQFYSGLKMTSVGRACETASVDVSRRLRGLLGEAGERAQDAGGALEALGRVSHSSKNTTFMSGRTRAPSGCLAM